MTSLRVSSVDREPSFQASKWISLPVLLETDEMARLFQEMGEFSIFLTSGLTQKEEGSISHADFLHQYGLYIAALKAGEVPLDATFRSYFSSVFSASSDHVYVVPVGDDKQLIRICKPVIQLQPHGMEYSPHDGKFRSMVLGDRISWGIQFSYPQLFENPKTREIDKVLHGTAYPNTVLFRSLQKWIRHHTIATPFIVDQKRVNVPIRLGKECLGWINGHCQLLKRGIKVETYGS